MMALAWLLLATSGGFWLLPAALGVSWRLLLAYGSGLLGWVEGGS